jgi:hypothetical protein
MTEETQILGLHTFFPGEKMCALILAKMFWATFRAIFSQAHTYGHPGDG